MSTIYVKVKNDTSDNKSVSVFDRFGGAFREVAGSPFALASDELSQDFAVNADNSGVGVIDYKCVAGPSLSNIEVENDSVVDVR